MNERGYRHRLVRTREAILREKSTIAKAKRYLRDEENNYRILRENSPRPLCSAETTDGVPCAEWAGPSGICFEHAAKDDTG